MSKDQEHGLSEDWDETEAESWVAQERRYEAMLGPWGLRMLDAASLTEGESVLDVGCGTGSTSLEAGRRVGPSGSVLGVDVSPAVLGRAGQRAAAEGLAHVRFEQGDAQTHPLPEGAFDAIVSRFGLQHFADPPAAFANLARALRPTGRIAFVCWRGPEHNAWVTIPMQAVARHMPLPPREGHEGGGPFALADPELVRGLLAGAGLEDVRLESVAEPALVGRDVEDTIEFFRQSDGRELAEQVDEQTMKAILDSLREAMAQYAGPEGLRVPAAAWLAQGRKPA